MTTSRRRLLLIGALAALALLLVGSAEAAGPPYPNPVTDQAVYDEAGVFSPVTISQAESTIDGIESRTQAEVVVYTQVKPGVDESDAENDAIALIDQWGIGRKGFDDGMVILFDLDESTCHGQVQLYAAPGFRATYLTNDERQQIYEDEMLPKLRECDLDGALLAAMQRVDEAATPIHAAALQRARQLDAVLGLVGAPLVFAVTLMWGLMSWIRHGQDPVYLDDPSIHIPAPPPDLTPASGALIMDGKATRRALTTATLDIAARGQLTFREENSGFLGMGAKKVGIDLNERAPANPQEEFRIDKARRQPLGPAEAFAYKRLAEIADDDENNYIEPDDLLKFGTSVDDFDRKLEAHVVDRGWFTEAPKKATERWTVRGIGIGVLGGLALFGGFNLPSSGLVLIGIAGIAAGVALLVIAQSMPARTVAGAMMRAMLAAYRRTLEKTMAQARSLDQVVAEAKLPWLETPDQAVVWGVALGLQHDVETVLERSVEDVREGRLSSSTYVPAWYAGSGGGGGGSSIGGSGGGLMSSSAIPNFGGMMAALGTIGNSPASSGSGGGFGGGGSGGGGGGAGGGF